MRLPACLMLMLLIALMIPVAPAGAEVGEPAVMLSEQMLVGAFEDLTPLTREKWNELLAEHRKWQLRLNQRIREETFKAGIGTNDARPLMDFVEELLDSTWGADEGRLVLKNAILIWANLQGEDLGLAHLQDTSMNRLNLQGANLVRTNLQGAQLGSANLQGANLQNANLQGAILFIANLQGADLGGANLQGANLQNTILQEADLSDVDLRRVNISDADLQGAIFEPKPDALPDLALMSTARNLSGLRFKNNPSALVELRTAFKDNGYNQQAREINTALQRSTTANQIRNICRWELSMAPFKCAGAWLSWAFFDLTVAYGLEPVRPLLVLILLIVLFAVYYALMLMLPDRDNGLWRVWPQDDRLPSDRDRHEPEQLLLGGWRALGLGLWFSLLSAFHFGWRELSVGNWLARMQPRAYSLRPTGRVRLVSGVQSLLSVYLLALWALTLFGNPFEY